LEHNKHNRVMYSNTGVESGPPCRRRRAAC
jgi:hypothetical protein